MRRIEGLALRVRVTCHHSKRIVRYGLSAEAAHHSGGGHERDSQQRSQDPRLRRRDRRRQPRRLLDRDPARPRRRARRGGRETARSRTPSSECARHFIQASGVPAIERLGLLDPIMEAGGVRPRIHAWTRWGWIEAPPEEAGQAVNLRREVLDPLVREAAAETEGVEMMVGQAAHGLLRDGADQINGVALRAPSGEETELRAKLVIGADGRDSKVAELAGAEEKTLPNERFAYGGYFEGGMPKWAPDGSIWFLDPHWAAAFPTDSGLTFYAAMPTKEILPQFKEDPSAALISFLDALPDGPPIKSARLVEQVVGKLDMTNRVRVPTAPGPGARRRRRDGRRPALRRRLRVGVPDGRMAGGLGRAGAARRGVARARPEALPPPAQTQAGRPRLRHPRLLDRQEADARRKGAVRRRRPRPEAGDQVRQVRNPSGRAGADDGDDAAADGHGQRPPRDEARRLGVRPRRVARSPPLSARAAANPRSARSARAARRRGR